MGPDVGLGAPPLPPTARHRLSPHPRLTNRRVSRNVSQQQPEQQQQQTFTRSAPGPPDRTTSPVCMGPFDPSEGSETDLSEADEEAEWIGPPQHFQNRGMKGVDSYGSISALAPEQAEAVAGEQPLERHPLNQQRPGSFGEFHANGEPATRTIPPSSHASSFARSRRSAAACPDLSLCPPSRLD